MKPKIVLGIAGKMGSGKSTLSTALAEDTGLKCASFGNYVRYIARQEGRNPESKEILQEIGESLVEKDPKEFCLSVLEFADWKPDQSLIVEGIRHVEVSSALQQITAPSKFVLTYFDIDEDIRRERLLRDRGVDLNQLEKLDSHSTEAQVKTKLLQLADYRLNANEPVETLVKRLREIYQNTLHEVESAPLKDDLVKRGQQIYDEQLKGQFEPNENGRYIAIEPKSGRYFLGDTGTEALVAAYNTMPDARFYLTRIGHTTAHTIGGYASRIR